MKKVLSILTSVVLLVSLFAIGTSAETVTVDDQSYTVVKAYDLTKAYPIGGSYTSVDKNGNTITATGGWANMMYEDGEGFSVTGNTYLVYDFVVADGGVSLSQRSSSYSFAALIAAKHNVTLIDGGDKLPAGTYKGVVKITDYTYTGSGPFHITFALMSGASVSWNQFTIATKDATSEGDGEGEGDGDGEGEDKVTVNVDGKTYEVADEWDIPWKDWTQEGNWAKIKYFGTDIDCTGKDVYLVYDFSIDSAFSSILFLADKNNSDAQVKVKFSTAIAAQKNVTCTGDDNDQLPAGTYQGVVKVEALNGNYTTTHVVGYGATATALEVNTFKLVTLGDEVGSGDGEDEGDGDDDEGENTPAAKIEYDLGIGDTYRDNWGAISEAVNGKTIDVTGKTVTVEYSFTITDWLSFVIRSGDGEAKVMELIAAAEGVTLGGDGGDKLPAGTYEGSVVITGWEGEVILGVVAGYGPQPDLGFGTGATAKLVLTDAVEDGDDEGDVPAGDAAPIAIAGLAIASAAALYFVSRKQK